MDFDNRYKAADLANEKLNKLIESSQTVYGYGITPMASSLWNMSGPEKESRSNIKKLIHCEYY